MTAPDFHSLHRGDALPPFEVCITVEDIRAYLAATGEPADAWSRSVPPLALGALLLAGLMDEIPLPAGAVHIGQDFEFVSPLATGTPVTAQLSIAQQSVRQGSNIVVFGSEVRDGDRVVLRGRTTVMAPAP